MQLATSYKTGHILVQSMNKTILPSMRHSLIPPLLKPSAACSTVPLRCKLMVLVLEYSRTNTRVERASVQHDSTCDEFKIDEL